MMKKVKNELSSNQTVLLLMPATEYSEVMVNTVKMLSNKAVCYVTLNKTCDSLLELLKKRKVGTKNIFFVDAISATIKSDVQSKDNRHYVSSPGALTEISLVVSKLLKHNFNYLIFDSLTNLLVYQNKNSIAKFVSSFINKVHQTNTKAIFYALSVQEQSELINESGMFVDKVVNWKKR